MNLLKFLPTENITYKTHLLPDAVVNRLAENVEPSKFRFGFFTNNSTKMYEGKIEGNTFSISRIIGYRNSFLPQIEGVVNGETGGTAIKVKMNIHPVVTIFVGILFTFFLFGWITVLFASIVKGKFEIQLLLGGLIVLFPYAMTMGGFKFESIKTKENLRELFQAKIISE